MSNALLNAVMPLKMSATEKVVLIVLAEAARDPDAADRPSRTWIPMSAIVARTCLGKRTVQEALRKLEASGRVTSTPRPGKGVVYLVHGDGEGCESRTSATAAPVRETARGGAAPAPNPIRTTISSSKTTSSPKKRARAKPPQAAFVPPDWIPADAWNGWLEMRQRKGAPLDTQHAFELSIAKLKSLADDGHPPGDVLDQSTAVRWTGLFPIKDTHHDRNRLSTAGNSQRQPARGSAADAIFAAYDRVSFE
jgi:hypothetical protein